MSDKNTHSDTREREPIAPPPDAPRPVATAAEDLRSIMEQWSRAPDPAYSTGLLQLDRLLGGGLRGSTLLSMTGAAKSGKTSLLDQVVYDAVRLSEGRAFGLVLSTEMRTIETISRWLSRVLHEARLHGEPWAAASAGYGMIQTGEAWQREDTRAAVGEAAERAREVLGRLVAERLPPMATILHVSERIARARERFPDAFPIVFLDPLQRLYAAPSPGVNVDRINEDEAARAGLVATQAFDLAEGQKLAILAALDTTKAGASGASAATGARGSYVVSHAATTILGFHRTAEEVDSAPWPDRIRALAARLAKEGGAAEGENEEALASWIAGRVPRQLWEHPDVEHLGRRAVYLECSGNRAGPAAPCAFGTIPGAALFAACEEPRESIAEDFGPSPSSPSPRPPRRGRS